MTEASDLTKSNKQIEIEQAQAEFDRITVPQETLDHMTPENMIKAMVIMKEDIQILTSQTAQLISIVKPLLERLHLVEMSVELIMRSDPTMVAKMLAALPPEAHDQVKEMFAEAGVEMPTAPAVSTATAADRPGTYL